MRQDWTRATVGHGDKHSPGCQGPPWTMSLAKDLASTRCSLSSLLGIKPQTGPRPLGSPCPALADQLSKAPVSLQCLEPEFASGLIASSPFS